MSLSLYWRPVPKDPPPGDVPEDMDYLLRKRYWEENGTPRTEPMQMSTEAIGWLEGLRDAGVEGASEMIAAIREHGTIELRWE